MDYILYCTVLINQAPNTSGIIYCKRNPGYLSKISLLRQCKQNVPQLKPSPFVCLRGPSEFPPSRLILKNDNVISAPFISHARAKRSNSLVESSQTPRPYLPCWANIVLKSHAPIVMDEPCMAQLDRGRNYNGTLCPCRSPFELLKCLQRKRPKYILSPSTHPRPCGGKWAASRSPHCSETRDTHTDTNKPLTVVPDFQVVFWPFYIVFSMKIKGEYTASLCYTQSM